jgi:hypothetical protein
MSGGMSRARGPSGGAARPRALPARSRHLHKPALVTTAESVCGLTVDEPASASKAFYPTTRLAPGVRADLHRRHVVFTGTPFSSLMPYSPSSSRCPGGVAP